MSLRLVQVVRDDWSRLSQCLVASLVGLHPALWFIGTQIDLERGAACDDDVVAHAREPRLRWIAAVAGGVALAVAVVGSDHIPPLVAFIDIQASAPSAPTHYQSRPVTLTPLFDAAPVVSGWAVVPTLRSARPSARAESVRTGYVFRMIGARAARVGLAAAGRARGLGEAVSSSFVAVGSRVAQKF